jgi:hypothetical protein
MSKTIILSNGIVTLSESKAICPKCARKIPFEEIENKWIKQDKHFMRFKCKCKRFIGITTNMKSDFIAFELNAKTNEC